MLTLTTPAIKPTPPLFVAGQKVTCIKGDLWLIKHRSPDQVQTPGQAQEYTIYDMEYWPQYDDWYVRLVECPPHCCYMQGHFAPIS